MTEAETAIAAVMAKHPTLTAQGFERPGSEDFDSHRADLLHPNGVAYFENARAWLSVVPARAAPNQECDSYLLKHVVEHWCGTYVSNGALIAAALHLGLAVRQCPSFINAWIGVAGRRQWPTHGKDGTRVPFPYAVRERA